MCIHQKKLCEKWGFNLHAGISYEMFTLGSPFYHSENYPCWKMAKNGFTCSSQKKKKIQMAKGSNSPSKGELKFLVWKIFQKFHVKC